MWFPHKETSSEILLDHAISSIVIIIDLPTHNAFDGMLIHLGMMDMGIAYIIIICNVL